MIFQRTVASFLFTIAFGRTQSWARPELPKDDRYRGPDSGERRDLTGPSKSNLELASGRHLLSTNLIGDNGSTSEAMTTENYSTVAYVGSTSHGTEKYSTVAQVNATSHSIENGSTIAQDNTTNYSTEKVPSWVRIFDTVQNSIAGLGFLLNMFTVITLTKNGSTFPKTINFLLRHQSVVDGIICIMAIIIITIPLDTTTTGLEVLDVFLCHFWFSQACYWAGIFISIANLLLISVERFLAICYPFAHKRLSTRHIKITLIVVYIFDFAMQIFPVYLTFHFTDGRCIQSPPFAPDKIGILMFFYSIYVFCIYWAIPCALFVILYGIVIYTLTKRNKQSTLGHSEVVAKASEQLTKTAIVVTVFFFVSIGYDLWYYALGNWHVVAYINNSPEQKAGVFMAVLNSCANPVIYAAFMPAYRKSIHRTLFCSKDTETKPGKERAASSSTNTLATSASENGGAIWTGWCHGMEMLSKFLTLCKRVAPWDEHVFPISGPLFEESIDYWRVPQKGANNA